MRCNRASTSSPRSMRLRPRWAGSSTPSGPRRDSRRRSNGGATSSWTSEPAYVEMPHSGGSEHFRMKLQRRLFLQLAAAAAAAPVPRGAHAQAYPQRPVRLIVPFASGGAWEILARLMGQWLSERLGQPFVIEMRPGAGGNVGTEAVVTSAPDGYTLLMVNAAPSAINATLYDKLSFNFLRDMMPIGGVQRTPLVLLVNPEFSVKSVPELIAYAKGHPGQINMASAGNGSPPHVAGELFKIMAGVDIVHVPYRGGGPALVDLLGGQVQMFFGVL